MESNCIEQPLHEPVDGEEAAAAAQQPRKARRLPRPRAESLWPIVRGLWRPLLVIAGIAAVILIADPRGWIGEVDQLRAWLDERGALGIVIFVLIYVIAAVAIVPQAVLKVAAGGLFGSVLGVVVASIGSTLGATACFLIARYVARGSLVKRFKQRPRIRKLDEMTRVHGEVIVALSRLVPILPGNLVNYTFGLTQVRLRTFVFWSWLCMLPGTVVLVVGTDALVRGLSEGRVPWGMLVIVAAALAMMAVAVVIAHRRFRERHPRDESFADI